MNALPKVFWDTDDKKLDFKKNSGFVIARVLERGNLNDIKWLRQKYSPSQIKKTVCESRAISEKTANFWSIFFNIPKNKIVCFKKSSQKKRKMFWPY